MSVSVQTEDFDVGVEVGRLTASRTDIGAVVTFTGLVRAEDGSERVSAMTLEHYPGMTEREIGRIVEQARERWSLTGVRVIHRYGTLAPGDRIVLVITASAHRQAAFQAAEFLMDYLKTRAPFWKLEDRAGKARWVDARETDSVAAARWSNDQANR